MTSTFTTKRTIEETHEVSLPCFRTHGYGFYKIIDEKNWIVVYSDDSGYEGTSIKIFTEAPCYAGNVLNAGRPISEEKFNEKFLEAKQIINSVF